MDTSSAKRVRSADHRRYEESSDADDENDEISEEEAEEDEFDEFCLYIKEVTSELSHQLEYVVEQQKKDRVVLDLIKKMLDEWLAKQSSSTGCACTTTGASEHKSEKQ